MLRNADRRRRLARVGGKHSSGTRPSLPPDDDYSNPLRKVWAESQLETLALTFDIFGFINCLMYGITGSYLSPPPPQSSLSRSGAGVGIAFRVRLP